MPSAAASLSTSRHRSTLRPGVPLLRAGGFTPATPPAMGDVVVLDQHGVVETDPGVGGRPPPPPPPSRAAAGPGWSCAVEDPAAGAMHGATSAVRPSPPREMAQQVERRALRREERARRAGIAHHVDRRTADPSPRHHARCGGLCRRKRRRKISSVTPMPKRTPGSLATSTGIDEPVGGQRPPRGEVPAPTSSASAQATRSQRVIQLSGGEHDVAVEPVEEVAPADGPDLPK